MPNNQQPYYIQLGDWRTPYMAYETTAPEDYDGFGTLSLHKNVTPGDPRWVLIRTEHESWQTLRYRSGMYSVTPVDLDEIKAWATERLHARLLQAGDGVR
jgi:hypothetical protein